MLTVFVMFAVGVAAVVPGPTCAGDGAGAV